MKSINWLDHTDICIRTMRNIMLPIMSWSDSVNLRYCIPKYKDNPIINQERVFRIMFVARSSSCVFVFSTKGCNRTIVILRIINISAVDNNVIVNAIRYSLIEFSNHVLDKMSISSLRRKDIYCLRYYT